MKVSKLIELLQGMEQDAEVHFSYNYGDHWRTRVAPEVETIDEGVVVYSDYHSMDKLVDDEEAYGDETGGYKEDARKVVILG